MPPIPEASARGPSSGTLKASPFAEFDAHDAACAAGAAAPDDLAPRGSLLSPRLSVSGSGLVRTLSRTASSIASAPRELARTMSQPLIPASVPPPTVWELWRVRWRMITAMFMIYVITLCIFPGFLAEDVKNLQLGSWYPVILFLVFNVGDMVGKLLPHFRLAPGQTACLLLSLSRIVFIPAFYCAARFGAPAAVMAILTLLLGLSNGFLTALFFKLSPIGLRAIVAEGTAEFMVIGLVAGLNVGCYLGWLWLLGH
ncbi:Equilibrative nucleoside transporter 4 [Monoraphidium neglectum]|uniref:Equilibrative nucleoside transporter 4 n=1 Tax=Monoraphidium neglectum TaxID=145388 RepID=A0A0D2M0U2_9CHLO|nr:Equilibrative nucleoside transporter 4 [Monoraphidium neglectum]KIY97259.1 Equilibrative nucleoside transporter 4 [Monoraphidium neglectum]|eukprot:XP_013896279.1 Equilibrative nucleoside transporter 4 [Monoraphidium neglectum]